MAITALAVSEICNIGFCMGTSCVEQNDRHLNLLDTNEKDVPYYTMVPSGHPEKYRNIFIAAVTYTLEMGYSLRFLGFISFYPSTVQGSVLDQ